MSDILRDKRAAQPMQDDHVTRAVEKVRNWPEWKQNALKASTGSYSVKKSPDQSPIGHNGYQPKGHPYSGAQPPHIGSGGKNPGEKLYTQEDVEAFMAAAAEGGAEAENERLVKIHEERLAKLRASPAFDEKVVRDVLYAAKQVIDCSEQRTGLIGKYADEYGYAKDDFEKNFNKALAELSKGTQGEAE